MTVTAVDERLLQIAAILDREIADLGYPVGMGMAPHPDTTERIAGAIAIAIEAELVAARKEIAGLREGLASEDQIKRMVDHFLSWKLPENFRPDGGISFQKIGNEGTTHEYTREPTGTNLLDATQADALMRYLIAGGHSNE